jgi:hypothetical protein
MTVKKSMISGIPPIYNLWLENQTLFDHKPLGIPVFTIFQNYPELDRISKK